MSDTPDMPCIELTRRGLCAEVSVRGELDLASAGTLDRLLEQVPMRPGAVVLLDLTACTFIDSSVIALLLRWHERAPAAGGELVVFVGPGAVLATLEVAGVAGILRLAHDDARSVGRPAAVGG